MKKIKNLLTMCLLTVPAVLSAEVYPWLTFRMSDNTEISVPSQNLKIDYSDRVLHVSTSTVTTDISIDKVKSMQFTSSSSAIDNVLNDGEDGAMEFFNVSGVKAGSFGSLEEARKSLPSGVYIIKNGEKSRKAIF